MSTITEYFNVLSNWIMNSRSSEKTFLITKDHILEGPYQLSSPEIFDEPENGQMAKVTISGINDSLVIRFNRVVSSKYRRELGIYTFDLQGALSSSRIFARLSLSKQKILESFPPGSKFTSDELYDKVRQAHARRRWKELKYEFGFDVDFDLAKQIYWRGQSSKPIRDPQVRPDNKKIESDYWHTLSTESKLLNDDLLPHCNYCDARVIAKSGQQEELDSQVEIEGTGLVDHRRPVFQGGTDDISNFQIFCQTCNNLKNSVCRRCPFHFQCETCIWAHPETFRTRRIVIHLRPELAQHLRSVYGLELPNVITKFLESLE